MPQLPADLVALARAAAGPAGEPVLLSARSGRHVIRVGDTVVKVHGDRTDPGRLRARTRLAADPRLRGVFLPPRSGPTSIGGRIVTTWPAATAVDPGTAPWDTAPWDAAAGLLARLHVVAPPEGSPPTAGPAGVARAVARLAGASHPAATVVRRAFRALPPWARGRAQHGGALVHGDWHLGQLAHLDGWHLIDVDDLGLGDPAWDLARPAALFAVGLLAPATWHRFLDAYRVAGGPALPGSGDPWARLDVPAQALAVRLGAQAVSAAVRAGRDLDDAGQALVDACLRIGR